MKKVTEPRAVAELLALMLVVTVLLAGSAEAQDLGQQMKLTPVTTIAGARSELTKLEGATVSDQGQLAVGDANEHQLVILGRDGIVDRVGREGEGPGEFRNIRDVGLTADGLLWVADSKLSRIQIFSWGGSYTRGFRYDLRAKLDDGTPLIVRPLALKGGDIPVFWAFVSGLVDGGIGNGRSVGDIGVFVPGEDRETDDAVLWMPRGAACTFRVDGIRASIPVPFCNPPVLDVSPDGHMVVVAVGTANDDGSVEIQVQVWDAKWRATGQWHQSFPGRRVLNDELANVRAFWSPRLGMTKGALNAYDNQTMPSVHAPVLGVLANDDGSIWIGTRTASGDMWVILGESGAVHGHIQLPRGETPIAVFGDEVWLSREDEAGFLELYLYELGS